MAREHATHLGLAAAVLLVSQALAPAARAQTKPVCAAASEHGQRMRMAERLLEALDDFAICARSTCPDIVARDCETWLAEVRARVPTILLFARTAAGDEPRDARVLVDGQLRAAALEGGPIPMPIGQHTLRIEAPGHAPAEQVLVLSEGEHGRKIEILVRKAAPRPPAESPTPDVAPRATRLNLPPLIVAGIGAGALVGGGALMAVALAGIPPGCDFATERCRPTATEAAVPEGRAREASTSKDLFLAGLGLSAAGVVGAGVGLAWYALHPRTATAGRPAVEVAVSPGWAAVGVGGVF